MRFIEWLADCAEVAIGLLTTVILLETLMHLIAARSTGFILRTTLVHSGQEVFLATGGGGRLGQALRRSQASRSLGHMRSRSQGALTTP